MVVRVEVAMVQVTMVIRWLTLRIVMCGYECFWGGCRWVMGGFVWLLVVMSGCAVVTGGFEWL